MKEVFVRSHHGEAVGANLLLLQISYGKEKTENLSQNIFHFKENLTIINNSP